MSAAESIDEALSMELDVIERQVAEPRERKPLDPWRKRRLLGFGASDVPALMVGLGLRDSATGTRTIRANGNLFNAKTISGEIKPFPRIVLEKARIKAPLAHKGGGDREAELLRAWASTLPSDGVLVASTVWHADAIPKRHQGSIRDVLCPGLAVNLDGGIADVFGDWWVAEAKCADTDHDTPAWPKDGSCPWFWNVQVQSQLAATEDENGIVVCGEGWAFWDGPIKVWPVQRDEALIAEIRSAVRRGMEMLAEVSRAA